MSENIPPTSGQKSPWFFDAPSTPPKKPSNKALGKRPMSGAQLALHYAKQPKLADDSDDEDFKRMHGVVTIPPDTHSYGVVPPIAPPRARLVLSGENYENAVNLTEAFLNDDDLAGLYDEDVNDAATDTPEVGEVAALGEIEDVVHEIDLTIKIEVEDNVDPFLAGMEPDERRAYLIAKEQLIDMVGLTEEEAREELNRRDEISGGRAW